MLTTVHNVQDVMHHFNRMAPFRSHSVDSLVPKGFQRYVRIFHPAWGTDAVHRIAIRWAKMANYTGATPHALMQWDNIAALKIHDNPVLPPDEGTIPSTVSKPLRDLLLRHTKSSNCWLGVWPGFGGNYRKYVPDTAVIKTKYREWKIFRASLLEIDIAFFEGWNQTANLIWCENCSWWITTGIDLNTTYMGGDEQLIQAVLDSPDLEAWPVEPDDDISKYSDTLNPIGDRYDDSAPQESDRVKKARKQLSRREWGKLQSNRMFNGGSGPAHYYSAKSTKQQKWVLYTRNIFTGIKKAGRIRVKLLGWIVLIIIASLVVWGFFNT